MCPHGVFSSRQPPQQQCVHNKLLFTRCFLRMLRWEEGIHEYTLFDEKETERGESRPVLHALRTLQGVALKTCFAYIQGALAHDASLCLAGPTTHKRTQ